MGEKCRLREEKDIAMKGTYLPDLDLKIDRGEIDKEGSVRVRTASGWYFFFPAVVYLAQWNLTVLGLLPMGPVFGRGRLGGGFGVGYM